MRSLERLYPLCRYSILQSIDIGSRSCAKLCHRTGLIILSKAGLILPSGAGHKTMPSKPMIGSMLSELKRDGILKTVRAASGRRAEVLAFAELINLAEGNRVI